MTTPRQPTHDAVAAAASAAGTTAGEGLLSILPSWIVSGGLAALASEALFGLFALAVLISAAAGGGGSDVPGEGGEESTASGENQVEAPEEELTVIDPPEMESLTTSPFDKEEEKLNSTRA